MYKIIFIDDEPMVLEGLEILLDWEQHGFEVLGMYNNVEDGLECIMNEKPDVIVTDIRMPEMSGLELIEHIKESTGQDTEIIILSGYGTFSYAQRALKVGVRYYLLKPVFDEDIIPVLEDIKKRHHKKKQLEKICIFDMDDFAAECMLGAIYGLENGDLEKILERVIDKEHLLGNWCYIQIALGADITEDHMAAEDIFEKHNVKVKEIIQNTLVEEYIGFVMQLDAKTLGVIISMEEEYLIESFIQSIYHKIKDAGIDKFYISAGSIVSGINTIKVSYDHAVLAMNYKVFKESGSIIYYKEVQKKVLNHPVDSIESIHHLLKMIEESDDCDIEKHINRLVVDFREKFVSLDIVRLSVVQLVYLSLSIIQQMGGDISHFLQNEPISILNDTKKVLTISEIKTFTIRYCHHLKAFLNRLRIKKKQSRYTEIEDYIKENYWRHITIKELSSLFYIHPVYLGQMFKKQSGLNFNEYLHRLRIEEAIKQLKWPNAKLNKIAENIGYRQYYNFLKYFKKYKGMTPKEYRDKYF